MKKILFLLFTTLFFGSVSGLKAQCYGNVNYDQEVAAVPTSSNSNSFTITTTHCNELIMISYDGWDRTTIGTGPITVDGNNATWINTANSLLNPPSTGAAETYAYIAPTVGVHNIVCTENGYDGNSGYDINFAADFYVTNSVYPLTLANLTSAETTVSCNTSGPITDNITTTKPNSMIYSNVEYNDGSRNNDPITWTNATFLADTHVGYGIEGSDAYTSANAPGLYTITADNSTSSFGCGGLALVLVAISPPICGTPLTATYTQVNPTCGNSNGSIIVTPAGGDAPYTYTWSPNVSTTNSATGLSAGTYSITVSDANCNVCNPAVIIVTLTGPIITLTTNITSNEPCFGNSVGSATAIFAGGTPPFTYNWTPTGGTNATATGLTAGTYTITAKDANGCTHTSTVTITQPAVLTASMGIPTDPICNGATGSVTVTASGGTTPYTYAWNPSGGTAPTATITAGTYTVNITDADGCTASASATITQPAAIDITITGPPQICVGATGTYTATVTGGSMPYAYTWSPGLASTTSTASITPLISQNYTVNVTDANGCTASAQFTIDLGSLLTVTTSGANSICSGTSATICANPMGGTGGNTYLWLPGNLTTPCITVCPASTTTYTISVADNCGTSATAATTVRVNPLPDIGFKADIYQGCTPVCTQFYNITTISQGGLAQYQWTFGNGDTADIKSPTYCYPKSGTYDVSLTVTSDSGCSSTLKKVKMISAFTRPTAAFTISPQPANILDPTVQFTDNSTDQYGIVSRWWSFGDVADSNSTLKNPTHTYQDTGRYCVELVVMNEHGCSDTSTNCLVVDPVFTLYIPSAFSPNGDGKNEIFAPKGQYIKSFDMYIFDRWGMQLFHTGDITKGWNGTVNGGSTVAQEDTYEYKILVTDSQNKQHTYVGNVSLIK